MVLGVDFGTFFSQVAVYDNGNVKMLETGGNYGTPSVFYYDSVQGEHVGLDAELTAENLMSAPGNLIRDVKMRLDESFNLDGKAFTSKEIVKSIYRAILTHAIDLGKKEYGEDKFKVDGIVISHPAEFKMQDVGLLADAAKDCIPNEQIKILGTIKEPVAAAINYYNAAPQPDGTNILVFDLGGGTCDLAVVTTDRKLPSEFFVEDSKMIKIGGRNWDSALIDYVIKQIALKTNNESAIRNNADYMNIIKKQVIEAKHDLTDYESTSVVINYKAEQHIIKLTREIFDNLTIDLLEKTLDALDEFYEKNVKRIKNLKSIICVGGSSKMPQVMNGIKNRFPDCDVRSYQPEYSVVSGAAIFAERMLSGFDFVPFSYGIKCRMDGVTDEHVVRNIITKGERYPVTHTCCLFQIPAGLPGVKLSVYESECKDEVYPLNGSRKEKLIGYIDLNQNKIAKDDVPVRCELTINSLHTIELKAEDKNGTKIQTKFKLSI